MYESMERQYSGAQEMATMVGRSQTAYDNLIAQFSELGTEVRRARLLERDVDCPPFRFIRRSDMEFIFPPQEVTEVLNDDRVIDPSFSYTLKEELRVYQYDEEQVRGHLRIKYEDADSWIKFSVEAIDKDKTEIPEAARTLIQDTFKIFRGEE